MEAANALGRELVEQGRADVDGALGTAGAGVDDLAVEGLATRGDLDGLAAKRVGVGVGGVGRGHVGRGQGDNLVAGAAGDATAAQPGSVEGHVTGAGADESAGLDVLDGSGEGQGEGGEDDGGELHFG